jgi:hypothetical protein
MKELELKLALGKKIESFINEVADKQKLETFFYHPELIEQMTDAALLVLNTARKNQEYFVKENR